MVTWRDGDAVVADSWGGGAVGTEWPVGAEVGREEGAAVAVVGEGSGPGGVAAGGAGVAAVAAAAAAAEAGGESEPASSAEIARRSVLVRACHST